MNVSPYSEPVDATLSDTMSVLPRYSVRGREIYVQRPPWNALPTDDAPWVLVATCPSHAEAKEVVVALRSYVSLAHRKRWAVSHKKKLTPKDVAVILARLRRGDMGADIARDYGVSPGLISHVRLGRKWRTLADETDDDPEEVGA